MTGRELRGLPGRGERGVALLSALFAVALLTIVVVEMTDATLVHMHLTHNAGNAMAAQLLARSAELAGEALLADAKANPRDITCRQSPWALPLMGIPVGSGAVGLQVSDEGGKLDLNAVLHDQKYREAVQALFNKLGVDPSLVEHVAAWITPAGDPAMATGAASNYCALSMACDPRQKALQSLDELLLIRGFDERTIALLRPFVTVIPTRDGKPPTKGPQLNVLTAEPQVLAVAGCDGSTALPDCPSDLEDADTKKKWEDDWNQWKSGACRQPTIGLGYKSDSFSIVAQGMVGDVQQTVRTTVKRNGEKVDRLWWQEAPLRAPMPIEAR
ncbi:type II secretion system minor pseudopilin GspK [Candidatus Binatia bacterium]|jgi:type II secretory pathway component PulK|nr:type II secretion system minor pseudopilin GspK [Candidatus Binatia bacterium]